MAHILCRESRLYCMLVLCSSSNGKPAFGVIPWRRRVAPPFAVRKWLPIKAQREAPRPRPRGTRHCGWISQRHKFAIVRQRGGRRRSEDIRVSRVRNVGDVYAHGHLKFLKLSIHQRFVVVSILEAEMDTIDCDTNRVRPSVPCAVPLAPTLHEFQFRPPRN